MTEATAPAATTPVHRIAERLPPWTGSIRFRLTAIYSVLLFGLAAAVVAGLYVGLSRTLDDEPISRTYVIRQPVQTQEGVQIREDRIRAEFRSVEQLANRRALRDLRNYSFGALGLLFLASLGVGWMVAGRVLAPIGHITAVARDIQATDLSRRIALKGPPDELRDLADTFDAMLARLDEAWQGQRRFIQEASHELRNPLAVMRTNLDVVLADPEATADDLRHTTTVVSRTVERMGRLVDDLLVYARTGSAEREREHVDVAQLLDETVDEFAATAEQREVKLVRERQPGVVVLGDRTALKQALANLVDNAVRVAPPGTSVVVSSGSQNGWARLMVADAGRGIAPEHQQAVFQRFWRSPDLPAPSPAPAGAPDASGRRTGLGLTIVRQIAESHGGHVGLASEPGVGSTFVIWLPATPAGLN